MQQEPLSVFTMQPTNPGMLVQNKPLASPQLSLPMLFSWLLLNYEPLLGSSFSSLTAASSSILSCTWKYHVDLVRVDRRGKSSEITIKVLDCWIFNYAATRVRYDFRHSWRWDVNNVSKAEKIPAASSTVLILRATTDICLTVRCHSLPLCNVPLLFISQHYWEVLQHSHSD